MKRAATLLVAATLGGCVHNGNGTVPVTGDYITAVQQATASLCRFLPTAEFIGDLFLSGETYENVTALASTICTVVTARSYRAGTVPAVRGIPVQGRFVQAGDMRVRPYNLKTSYNHPDNPNSDQLR